LDSKDFSGFWVWGFDRLDRFWEEAFKSVEFCELGKEEEYKRAMVLVMVVI
jgi:hypothetical protein